MRVLCGAGKLPLLTCAPFEWTCLQATRRLAHGAGA